MTAPVDELVEKARELARAQRQVPSRNALKAGLKVGSEKAAVVRARLLEESKGRKADRLRALKRVAVKGSQARRGRVFGGGLGPGLPVPVSPIVGPAVPQPEPQANTVAPAVGPTPEAAPQGGSEVAARKVVTWPILLVAGGAFVAIWAGWVALGKLTGFGKVDLLPGFTRDGGPLLALDIAITLPLGMEAYSAYAFYVWLHHAAPRRARRFAAWSSLGAVVLGMAGQTAFHLMAAAGMTSAPWQITTIVSCLPVAVFGLACALAHLVRAGEADAR